jgi:hypothetical protein
VSSLIQIAAVGSAALLTASAAAAHVPALSFRNEAAEVSAASRLLSAYGVVTSTFRTIAHNKAVGGVPNSYHLLDRAIDVARRAEVTHSQIEAALKRAGYNLVESLDERDHSHFAFAALPGSAAPAPQPSVAPAPAPKPLPRVAADEHGTLAIDVQEQAAASAPVATATLYAGSPTSGSKSVPREL